MKNILIPTDFSATASNAVKAGMNLAKRIGARVHLYSCLDLPSRWQEMTAKEQKKHPEKLQLIENARILFREWIRLAEEEDLSLTTSWSGGNLFANIQQMITAKQFDFIVMGSHGASGKNEYFIGSNAQKTVRAVHCPVLIIKDDLENYQLDKVIFASDFDTDEKEAFQYLLDFTAPFDSEIHLVAINTSGWFNQPAILVHELMNDFAALCGDRQCQKHFYRGGSIDAGIRNYAQEINADLIAISNRQRHPLKRLFVGSNVEALVNHAKIPVMSIDFITKEEENDSGKRQQLDLQQSKGFR